MQQNQSLVLDEQVLNQIATIIVQSASASNEIQKDIYNQINVLSEQPLFLNYLVQLYSTTTLSLEFRYRTGIILKSVITKKDLGKLQSVYVQHLQNQLINCFNGFSDNRKTTSLIVSTLITHAGINKCQPLINHLLLCLQSPDNLIIAVDCLSKMIEDLKYNQENISFYDSSEGLKLIDSLILQFLTLLQQQNLDTEILSNAINFLNYNVFFMPPSLSKNCQTYIQMLLCFCNSSSLELRSKCIQGFQVLVETKRDYLSNNMADVVKFAVTFTLGSDKVLAKDSMIFLTDFLRIDDDEFLQQVEVLRPHVIALIPHIVDKLQMTQADLINIMPTFETEYKAKDELVDEDDIGAKGEFTIRKVAGKLLEKICDYYEHEAFQSLSQILEPMIITQNWKIQEAAFLCFGTVASQLLNYFTPGLPRLMEYLFGASSATSPHLRSTALWTISQYHTWIQSIAQNEQMFVIKYLELLLKSMDDPEIVVQEAACNSLNRLAADLPAVLTPFIEQILAVYLRALDKSDPGILLFIYSSLSSVVQNCDSIKHEQTIHKNQRKYAQVLLTKLVVKLEAHQSNDYSICPLLECLTMVIDKFEEQSSPYYEPIFNKCFQCVQAYLQALEQNQNKFLYKSRQIYMNSLQLLSSLAYVLKGQFYQLSTTQLIPYILLSLRDPESDVKQYAISFLGEAVKSCPAQVDQFVDQIIVVLCNNVHDIETDPLKSYLAVTNNSIWSLAEVAVVFPHKLGSYQQQLIPKVIQLIDAPKLHRHIAQNFAVALTRFCQLNLQNALNYVPSFFKRTCIVLSESKSEEFIDLKNEAFRTLFQLILLNPQQILADINYLFYSFVNFDKPSNDNIQVFLKIAVDFKQSVPPHDWEARFTGKLFPPGFRNLMKNKYEL